MNAKQIEKLKINGKRWGISDEIMNEVIGRDKHCVYCREEFGNNYCDKAEWEHINNKTNKNNTKLWNIALCCGSCNRSKNNYSTLRNWLKNTPRGKTISQKNLAEVIREYIEKYEKE